MATRMYIRPAAPILAKTTLVVRKCEFSLILISISFRMENIYVESVFSGPKPLYLCLWQDITHVLVTRIGKDHYGKATQSRNGAAPSDNTNRPSILHRIALDEVCYNEDDQITNRNECNDARVLERVQTAKEG